MLFIDMLTDTLLTRANICMVFSVWATDLALGCCCLLQVFQLHRFHLLDHKAGHASAH